MLQFMGSQKGRHGLASEQQQSRRIPMGRKGWKTSKESRIVKRCGGQENVMSQESRALAGPQKVERI